MASFRNSAHEVVAPRILKKLIRPSELEKTKEDIEKIVRYMGGYDASSLALLETLAVLQTAKPVYFDEEVILAAILAPRAKIKRANRFAVPTPEQIKGAQAFLEGITGRDARGTHKKTRSLFDNELARKTEDLARNILQLSELNFGGGIGNAAEDAPQQAKEGEYHAFRHMVMEVVEDPQAMLLRGALFLSNMHAVMLAHEKNPTDETRTSVIECYEDAENIYIPLAAAYGHTVLRDKLMEHHHRMQTPDKHLHAWERIIGRAQDAAPAGKKKFVRDGRSAASIVIDDLATQIRGTIPDDLRGQCDIEGNIKSTFSAERKMAEKASDIDDVIRLRIITPTDDDPLKTVMRIAGAFDALATKETAAAARREKALEYLMQRAARPTAKVGSFFMKTRDDIAAEMSKPIIGFPPDEREYRQTLEKAKKDARGEGKYSRHNLPPKAEEVPYTGPNRNYYKNPKPNGYMSYHMVLERKVWDGDRLRTSRFELQIVDEETHKNNTSGTAAHGKHYKYGHFPDAPDSTASVTVSVFTPENNIVELGRSATAIDYVVAKAGPTTAFMCNSVIVKKHPLNLLGRETGGKELATLIEGFDTVLQPGDTVMYTTAPELLYEPKHRFEIIDASRITRQQLLNFHNQLPDEPGERPDLRAPTDKIITHFPG